MKSFSRSWISSSAPKKQRKFVAKAPLHIRHKLVAAHLSKELRLKHKKRAFPVRRGDKVKIMVGKYRGVIGDVTKVDMRRYRIYVKGAEVRKKEGAPSVNYPLHPSNLQIITLNTDDKRRMKALERK
jgi:large subunit ribosomal protein L24